jgi:lysophospholipase L1-like esterase
MRRSLTVVVVVTLLAVFAVPVAGATDGGLYISLGDSVAAGTEGPFTPLTDHAYTDILYKRLRRDLGLTEHLKLACPGEDSKEMVDGLGSYCYGASPQPWAGGYPAADSQLDAAVAALTANAGRVELITITVGANDILPCLDAADMLSCAAGQLGQIGANLPVVVGTLRTVAPDVPIVAMNYYNPVLAWGLVDPGLADMSQLLVQATNDTLEAAYGYFGVPVADMETAFKTFKDPGRVPLNLRVICKYTGMCEKVAPGEFVLTDWRPTTPEPDPDIHPNLAGHRRLASIFKGAIESAGIVSG